jgi:ABC-type nickel/cobalt efflux system permease component RcnA
MAEIIVGIIFLLMGTLSLIYNKRSAQAYAETWGRRLKHGYAIGRFISIFGAILLLLAGVLMLFARRAEGA